MNVIQIDLNVVYNDKDAPNIERYIIIIKERVQCIKTTLPFDKLPRKITIKIVTARVFRINAFPKIAIISAELCSRDIIAGNFIY